jgi:MYXO-CTERM domain-containing protein
MRHAPLATIATVGLLLVPARAFAAQFVVSEVTYEHSATTTTDSHLRLAPSSSTPANWKAPVDYASAGKVHVRLEVFTKPSAAKTRFQICFEATPSYACTDQSPIYTTTGVYEWATSFPRFYQYDKVDWTKGVRRVALILKDDMNVKPAPENVGATRAALFMPTKLRVTVTVVEPGSTYVPPSTTADAGADASDATTDASDAAIDAPASDATPDDAPGEDTGATTDDGGVTLEDSGAVDVDAAAAIAPSTEDSGGCATSRGRAASPLFPLLALALFVARRRR